MLTLLLLTALALAGNLQVDVLDVGQGDAILIRSPAGKSVLIDAGDGGVDVAPLLLARGVQQLDLVIATHPHADHIGGMDEVLSAIPAKIYVDNGLPHTTDTYNRLMALVERQGITYKPARNGQTFNLDDGAVIELLHPGDIPLSGTRSDLNSNSVVARLTHGDNCFLFVGDAEEPTEEALMHRGIQPCGVLKVAHHGSAHSTTDAWLRAVKPEIALISVGEGNRYGHPTQDALDRLASAGAAVYRTDLNGTIHLESDKKKVTVSTESAVRETIASAGSPAASPAPPAAPKPPAAPAAPPAAPGAKIVLNTASAAELESIPGIGPSRAQAIIAYRDQNGPFASFADLEKVSGIGPKTRQVISEHAVLNP